MWQYYINLYHNFLTKLDFYSSAIKTYIADKSKNSLTACIIGLHIKAIMCRPMIHALKLFLHL